MAHKQAKQTTEQLLDKVNGAHDWKFGQTWQWEACGVQSTGTCRICGLTWRRSRNGQNSSDSDDFADAEGNALTLRDVANLEPCIQTQAKKPPVLRPALEQIVARIEELEASHCNSNPAKPVDFAEIRGLWEIAKQALSK